MVDKEENTRNERPNIMIDRIYDSFVFVLSVFKAKLMRQGTKRWMDHLSYNQCCFFSNFTCQIYRANQHLHNTTQKIHTLNGFRWDSFEKVQSI